MIELGATPPADDLIKDVSEADFMAEVIEASQTVPVIVDFWAPWCGPCKTLGPQLEAAVTKAKGAVKMAKVNVDEAQMIAGQLRVQSIPTVYAFWQGQPIDGFQGAVPPSEIDAFVARAVEAAGGDASGGLDEAVEAAEEGRVPQRMPPRPLPRSSRRTRRMPGPMPAWRAPIWRWTIPTRRRRS